MPTPRRSALTRARWAAATSCAATPTLLNTVTSSPISGLVPANSSRKDVLGRPPCLDQIAGLLRCRGEVVDHHVGPLQQVGGEFGHLRCRHRSH